MYRYLIIESKKSIHNDESMIISLFSEFIDFNKKETDHHAIYLFYTQEVDISFSEVILNIMSDTLSDLRLYASYGFETEHELNVHLEFIKKRLATIPFIKHVFLDDKVIVSESLNTIDDNLRSFILKKYTHDQVILQSIKIYLESNQNTSVASKKLYVHRNTLVQRLDKFNQVTGFDVRIFLDAYLIYHLLK
ncbi:MAG: helix-turn-helix domain-containing protein [Acholeplasmataceae bacterium]|nr:helix-turn-helix domain-containing protein [Acholeplasmataceae bacterium]